MPSAFGSIGDLDALALGLRAEVRNRGAAEVALDEWRFAARVDERGAKIAQPGTGIGDRDREHPAVGPDCDRTGGFDTGRCSLTAGQADRDRRTCDEQQHDDPKCRSCHPFTPHSPEARAV